VFIHEQIMHASYENSMFGFAYITRMTLKILKILSRNRLAGDPKKFPFWVTLMGFRQLTIYFFTSGFMYSTTTSYLVALNVNTLNL